jgi:hypothetical protein
VAVTPAQEDRPGHFVVARGHYADGSALALTASRDHADLAGSPPDWLCVALEPGPSGCNTDKLSDSRPITATVHSVDCLGTAVFGRVVSAARRVRVRFPDGAPYDAEMFRMPGSLRKGERLWAVHIDAYQYPQRVVARDRRGRVIGRVKLGGTDYSARCARLGG